jgi:hypothetical protein
MELVRQEVSMKMFYNEVVDYQPSQLRVLLKGWKPEIMEPSQKVLDFNTNVWQIHFPISKNIDAIWDFRLDTRSLDRRFVGAVLFIDGYPVSKINRSHEGSEYMTRYPDDSLALRFFNGPLLARMLYDHDLHIIVYLDATQPKDVYMYMHYGMINYVQMEIYMSATWSHSMKNAQGEIITFQFINGDATILYPTKNGETIAQLHRRMNPIIMAVGNQWSLPNQTTIRM